MDFLPLGEGEGDGDFFAFGEADGSGVSLGVGLDFDEERFFGEALAVGDGLGVSAGEGEGCGLIFGLGEGIGVDFFLVEEVFRFFGGGVGSKIFLRDLPNDSSALSSGAASANTKARKMHRARAVIHPER